MPNALAEETSPYLRQHAENPVDWLPWGPAGARPRRPRGQAAARLDRLLRLSLVSRDGAGVLRGLRDGIGDERGLRMRQGRSRGASGRRCALHGGGTGNDRTWRLAPERLSHPRADPVLRRHLLPPGRPRGDALLDSGPAGDRRRMGGEQAGDPGRRRAGPRAALRRGAPAALGRAVQHRRAR